MADLSLPPLYHASTRTMDVCSDSMPPTPLSADLSIPYQYLTYPFLSSLGRLPLWFLVACFFTGYLGVVGRKEWPHFFRFHVVTGMLLEILLEVVGIVYGWLPHGFYWGKIGMHFWVVIGFGCLHCA